jgi:TolB-like protein
MFCRSDSPARTLAGLLLLLISAPAAFPQDLELTALAAKLREQIVKSNKKTVAVWDLSNSQGYGSDFSEYMADELSIRMVQDNPGFRVVTRSRLNQLLRERGMKYTQDFDPATFQKIGSFTGADAVVAGSFQVLTSSIRVVLQVLDPKDATIVTGVSGTLPKTKDLEAYLQMKSGPTPGEEPAFQASTASPNRTPVDVPSASVGRVVNLNGGLQAQLLSLGREGRIITTAVKVTNTGQSSVFLILRGYASAIDDGGVKFEGSSGDAVSGVTWCYQPLATCLNPTFLPLQNYTEIDPGRSITVHLKLAAPSPTSKGKTISISAEIAYRLVNDLNKDGDVSDAQKVKQVRTGNMSFEPAPVKEN